MFLGSKTAGRSTADCTQRAPSSVKHKRKKTAECPHNGLDSKKHDKFIPGLMKLLCEKISILQPLFFTTFFFHHTNPIQFKYGKTSIS